MIRAPSDLRHAFGMNFAGWAWKKEKLPVTDKLTEPLKDGKIPELEPLEVPVPMKTVQDNLKTKEFLEVDARPALRFQGIGETIDHKAGHIPGAVNRPGSENFLPDGRFKPAPVLREEFLKLLDGRTPDKVINSCGSGVNASANLFAMDLSGLYGSKLYVGSWSQWIDDDANPVATGK